MSLARLLAPELRFRGLHFFAGTIPGFVLKVTVSIALGGVAMSHDRAARYRRLPPRGLGLMLPVSSRSPTQRIADDTPTR
jgi:hypothetical protein